MIWTSRLALIAYVLGGWLLPATHHHAHHTSCQHEAHGLAAPQEHGCSGHSHGCDDHAESSTESPETHISEFQVAAAPPSLICDGLCALCSARSLTSTTLKQKSTSSVCNDATLCTVPMEWVYSPAAPTEEHLSRGPPAIV